MIAQIGKYTIEKELGHGGYGDVFLAFDPSVGQKVAIKHLRTELGLDPEMLKRFQHEIRTSAGLRHKNIVTIFASDVEDGNPYLVMEFLEGQTLRDIIQAKRPLTLLEKVNIMTQVAEGLAYAHSKGIVHRDVKPENIMLLPDDSVKIMDFGIALAPDRNTNMTETGGIIGTPPYFAPEQLEGAKANEQTDIFSLGDVYYELLTGQHPFERFKHDWKMLQIAILSFDPPAVSELASCPEALELLVHRMLAKEREFRYATFEEMLLDGRSILVDLQRERTEELLREVPSLVETGDLHAALARLREAQQLDPGNREARQLRDTITQKLQRTQVQGRVSGLLAGAESLMAERRFAEAVKNLESAARLDSSNVTVQVRLGEAKTRLDSSVRASRLVSEARLTQQKGQLREALEQLTAALAIDPEHTEALALCPRVRGLVERRERDRRREQAIQTATDRLAAKRFSEALAELAQIEQEQPGAADVAQLRERIEQAQAEHERVRRTERFNLAVTRTRETMLAGELDRAGRMLDHLFANFANEPGAAGVLPALREQLDAQIRAQQLASCREEARNLLQEKSYRRALDLLADALRRFPGDIDLEQMHRSAGDLYRAHQRSEAIAVAMREAAERRDAGDFRGALDIVAAARQRLGDEGALVELSGQLEIKIEQQRYAAGLEQLLYACRQLMTAGKYSQAMDCIAQAPEYGGEAEVRALLESARELAAIAEERRVVAEALATAEGLSAQGDWGGALSPIEKALARYPHDPKLKASAVRLREQIARERQRTAIEGHRATIRREIQDGAWKKAEAALLLARSEFPDGKAFDDLAAQLEAGLFNARLDEVASGVREKLAANNLPEAVQTIEATQTVFAHDPRWKSLAEEVAKRRAYEAALVEAERHRKEGDLAEAETLLAKVLREGPADPRATQIIGVIQAERSEAARMAEIAAIAARVRERLARDDIEQAASELTAARAKFPGESVWAPLDAEIDARQAAAKRRAEIEARQAAAKRQAEIEAQQAAAKRQAEIEAQQAAAKRQAAIEAQQAAAKRQAEIEAQQAAAKRQAEMAPLAESIRASLDRGDLAQAAAGLSLARANYPGESLWTTLEAEAGARQAALEAIERERAQREQDLQDAQRNAEALAAQGRLEEALASLEGRFGGEPRVEELIARLRGDLDRRQRESDCARLLAIEQQLASTLQKRKVRKLDAEAAGIAARHVPDEEFASIASRIHARAVALLEAPAAKKPLPWKLIGGGAVAAAAVAALVLLVPKWFHKHVNTASRVALPSVAAALPPEIPNVPVEIRTAPQGASVRVGDRSCVTPDCRIDLAPGQYQVQAELKGFQPVIETLTVDASKSPNMLDLTLAPLPPPPSGVTGKLVVLAGQAGVLVAVDGIGRGLTDADGSLTLLVEARTHDVQVDKDRYLPVPPHRQVTVRGGAQQEVRFTLLPKEAKVETLSAPTGVELTLPPAPAETAPPPAAPAVSVELADGLPFQITLTEDVPSNPNSGHPLRFAVTSDIRARGSVVIAKGAAVTGEIMDAGKRKIPILAPKVKPTFRLVRVDAVDGTRLKIRTTPTRQPDGKIGRTLETQNRKLAKDLAAAAGAVYIAYIDGAQTVTVRP